MSRARQVAEYLAKKAQEPHDQEWTPINPTQAAQDIGVSREKFVKQLSYLGSHGHLTLIKDTQGQRQIIGFTDLKIATAGKRLSAQAIHGQTRAKPQPKETPAPVVKVRRMNVPALNEAAEARSALHAFVEQFPGLADEATLMAQLQPPADKVSQYVEEGLSVLERNAWLEERVVTLTNEVEELRRYQRTHEKMMHPQMQEALATAGVTHADSTR